MVLLTIHVRIWMNPEGGLGRDEVQTGYHLDIIFDSLSKGLKDIDNTGVVSMDNIAKILDKDAEGYPKLLAKYFQYVDGVGYQLTSRWADKTKSEITIFIQK